MSAKQQSKTRKFVADGVFYAELNEFLSKTLGEDGYSGVEVRKNNKKTQIIIRATRTQNVLGEKGRRIRELSALIQQRFNFPKDQLKLYAARVENRALSAIAQAESLRFKLMEGGTVRKVASNIMRYCMENGAKGCELIISGKLRAQRAKAMKFKAGYMIKSGYAAKFYTDVAVRHLNLKQGVLGIKVRIMLPHDPTGKNGCSLKQPDLITIAEPSAPKKISQPKSSGFAQKQAAPQQQQQTIVQPAQTQQATQQAF